MRRICFALLLLVASTSAFAQSSNPDSARIVTEDIERFWQAYDRAAPDFEAEPFQKLYLNPGSIGLKGFIENRIVSAEKLAETISERSKFYASIRKSTGRVREMEPEIRAAFYAMKYLYPEAVFPNVYFVIGRMNSGGTASDEALIIGAEIFGRTPNMPTEELSDGHRRAIRPVEDIPLTVAHELIHFQQKYPKESTLLARSIREGAASFLADLITGSSSDDSSYVSTYAEPREEELWREFKQKMYTDDYTGWLYNGNSAKDRPADLGYWMGDQLVEAYYEQAGNKRQAIEDILEIDDFDAFLERSGYPDKFSK